MVLFRHTLGVGEPLIILHGLFGISDNWITVGRKLSKEFRVIIPDLRNHGRSPHADAFNYFAMIEDILELYEDIGINTATVIGHSMGGKLAMNFAVQYPDMVDKLVVADISPGKARARQIHFRILKAMQSIDFDCCSSRQEVDDLIAEEINSRPIRLYILKNLVRSDKGRYAWRLNLDAVEKHIDEIMEGLPSGSLFNKEALFIRGGKSDYITDDDLSEINRIFPKYQLETIRDAGHWLHADNHGEFTEKLLSFLRQ